MTLLAAASTSMPWATTAPATIMAETNTTTPVGLLMLRSSSFRMCQALESRRSWMAPTARRHPYSWVWRSILVVRSGGRFPHLHLFRSCQMRRSEIKRHAVDLAVEPKWHLVVLIVDPGAGIHPDVEALV